MYHFTELMIRNGSLNYVHNLSTFTVENGKPYDGDIVEITYICNEDYSSHSTETVSK